MCFNYISRALWLVNFAGPILQYGQQKLSYVFERCNNILLTSFSRSLLWNTDPRLFPPFMALVLRAWVINQREKLYPYFILQQGSRTRLIRGIYFTFFCTAGYDEPEGLWKAAFSLSESKNNFNHFTFSLTSAKLIRPWHTSCLTAKQRQPLVADGL